MTGGSQVTLYYDHLSTMAGQLIVMISDQGLRYLGKGMPDMNRINPTGEQVSLSKPKVAPYISKIKSYLIGEQKLLDLPLDINLIGTEFQRLVWQALCEIPYGCSLSYEEVAIKIARPKSIRAVGTAIGKNPVLLQIPCHRVIRKDGTLGGYAGGLALKKKVLDLEGINYEDR